MNNRGLYAIQFNYLRVMFTICLVGERASERALGEYRLFSENKFANGYRIAAFVISFRFFFERSLYRTTEGEASLSSSSSTRMTFPIEAKKGRS
jgi:hypothetical protein